MRFLERKFITPSELFNLISSKKDCRILDMRSKSEFEEYHICRSVNVSKQDISSKISQIQSERPMPIILVSEFEVESREVLALLDAVEKVFYLKGGMRDGWFKLINHIRANELK